MTLTVAAKNTMLNALVVDTMSLHSGFPGLTGANEISGGTPAYARKACTMGVAAGGIRTTSGTVTFDVGASATVRWVGFWSGATFVGYAANGGAPREFVAVPSTDTVMAPAHGWANGQAVVFYNGTVPGGLTEGTAYYVINAATDSFQVSTTPGGSAVDITSTGSTDCIVSSIAADTYGSQGTHSITTATIGLPF